MINLHVAFSPYDNVMHLNIYLNLYGAFFIIINLVRPLEVEIVFNNNMPLSADRKYEVQCEAIGSRPPSLLTWWMAGIPLLAQPAKVNLLFA
jgi:hypothetical protein